jgi:hypothetical protein
MRRWPGPASRATTYRFGPVDIRENALKKPSLAENSEGNRHRDGRGFVARRGWCDLTERKRNNRPGGEAGTNVVLVIIDSLRRDHVGAYGNDWIKTPNLDALAKESLRFTRPYPESIPTLCARRAIHTGQGPGPSRTGTQPRAMT